MSVQTARLNVFLKFRFSALAAAGNHVAILRDVTVWMAKLQCELALIVREVITPFGRARPDAAW